MIRGQNSERRKSPPTLALLASRNLRKTFVDTVRHLKERNSSWYPRYFGFKETTSISRHAAKTLCEYILSTPHLFQVIKDIHVEQRTYFNQF